MSSALESIWVQFFQWLAPALFALFSQWMGASADLAQVPPPMVDEETNLVLRRIDPLWPETVAGCAIWRSDLQRKTRKPCAKLLKAVAKAARSRPLVHAHVFGRAELPRWLREAAKQTDAHSDNLAGTLSSSTREALEEVPTDLNVEAHYLLAGLTDPAADERQRAVLAGMALARLKIAVCARPDWLNYDETYPRCATEWEAWLRERASQSPEQWQAWLEQQLRPRLRSKDWGQRYMGLKALARPRLPMDNDPDVLRVLRDLITQRDLREDLLNACADLFENSQVRSALYPPDEPSADWTWAVVPLADPSSPTLAGVPRAAAAPRVPEPSVPPAERARFAALQKALGEALDECRHAVESLRCDECEPDTGPEWCYTDKAFVDRAAGPVLSAHLIGARILAGGDLPEPRDSENNPKDVVSQAVQILRQLCTAGDRRIVQTYAAHALQRQLVLLAEPLSKGTLTEQHLTQLHQAMAWASAAGDVTFCDSTTASPSKLCLEQWSGWLYASSQLSDSEFDAASAREVMARLRSSDSLVAALAVVDTERTNEVGARTEDQDFDPNRLAQWTRRNLLLRRDSSPRVIELVGHAISVRELWRVLYPDVPSSTKWQPSRLTGLHPVDLSRPPRPPAKK